MEFHIMAIKKSSGSGIPFGNNAGRPANPGTGQLYSNGQTQRLELYTSAGNWENIVQEVPGVSSVSGNYSEQTNSGVITIFGTNFVNGSYATAIGSNGVQINADSTVYNSLVQLTATFTGLSNAQEPYDIKVTNPSNLFGMIPDALYINASPVWQTASGSLGTFQETVSISLSATATDSDSTISYALASGSSLPTGVTLNSVNGLISGTLPNISTDTTYSFTINATDGLNVIPRSFTLTSLNAITVPSTEYLVIAGGGGGGGDGGYGSGGGAGGFRYGSMSPSSSTAYSIVVGLGGTGQTGAGLDNATVGGDSTFATITSAGGGRGRGISGGQPGIPGGSGSGGDRNPGGAGNTPSVSPVQGYAGGAGGTESTGGGGGAGGVGLNGGAYTGGGGGPGAPSSITGVQTYYAGGGGGVGRDSGSSGGIGGGGNGGSPGNSGTAGSPNTGGGGGAGGTSTGGLGSNGGSGVIFLAYQNAANYKAPVISGGLTYTLDTTTRSGYRVYRFTAGSGTITF
jgi:hypothetical protein